MAQDLSNIGPKIIMSFNGGEVVVTETVFSGAILAGVIAGSALWLARGLKQQPSKKQVVAETLVEFVYNTTRNTMGAHNINFAPYIGTIMLFLVLGNALGLVGLRPITADVNMTFALSTITFFLVQFNSFRSMGLKGKLRHMCEPYAFMFPLKVIEAVSQPISLGFRLFGNILAGVIVMSLIFAGLGGLCHMLSLKIPILQAVIPLPAALFFDVFHPIIQAYIFTMLTMVFISMEILKHGDDEHHS